jgi:hypothetical protein
MKLTDKKLRNILKEAIAECGEPMPHEDDHHETHETLDDVVDMLSTTNHLDAGEGGKATMARGHLYHMAKRAQSLYDRLSDNDDLPEWAQSKLAVAESMINSVYDHLDHKMHKRDQGSALGEINAIVREAIENITEADPEPDPKPVDNPTLIKSLKSPATAKMVKKVRPNNNADWAKSIQTLANMSRFDNAKFKKLHALISKHGLKADDKADKQKKPGSDKKTQSASGKEFKSF